MPSSYAMVLPKKWDGKFILKRLDILSSIPILNNLFRELEGDMASPGEPDPLRPDIELAR